MVEPGDLVTRRSRRKIYLVLKVLDLEFVVFDLHDRRQRYVSRHLTEKIPTPEIKRNRLLA